MKKRSLHLTLMGIALMFIGTNCVWAQSGPDLSTFTWANPIVDEDFSGVSTVSSTSKVNPAATNLTKHGSFNELYNNNTANTYGIENTVFGSNALFLYSGNTTAAIVTAITGKSFGNIGAFTFKVKKTNNGMVGLYTEGATSNAYEKAKASVYLKFTPGDGNCAVTITNGTSWKDVGTFTTDNIEIFVIYNASDAATTYGNSVSLAKNTAHIFVNGSCVMDGANPKVFNIVGGTIAAFRAVTNVKNAKLNVDDVKIYSGLPTKAITISAATWASFSNANEVKIPDGVTAYYASSSSGSSVTLKEITGDYIPANEGVVLNGTAKTYYTTVTSTSAAIGETNLLKPNLTDQTLTSDYYTLAVDGSSNPIFKKSTGVGTLAAGKAYLDLTGGAPELGVDFGGTTGIDNVQSSKVNVQSYYNLAGQRVAQPTKGLYIVNGKKVIIK